MAAGPAGAPLLSVQGLCVDFVSEDGLVRAVDRVSFEVGRGELLGLAGESGSGKSTVAQALLRLLPSPAVISGGRVLFEGRDLTALDETGLRQVRWRRLSLVFQGALDALNPVLTVGAQLADTLRAHGLRGARVKERSIELLGLVGLRPEHLACYPHQLSGGMRQRVGIALALALEPALVVLDEPTTALDVLVEQEILRELQALRTRLGFSAIFITHDLTRMLQLCDRVGVLYAGRLVELAPAAALASRPLHPYTQGLLAAFPSLDGGDEERPSIPGAPPSLRSPPPGCRFHPRCPLAVERCRLEEPPLVSLGERRQVACHLAG